MVTLGEQVEGLGESSQFRVHRFCRDVQDTAVSNSWGNLLNVKTNHSKGLAKSGSPTNLNVLKSKLILRDLQSETLGMDAECQMTRRFVTRRRPLSPEFPWISRRSISLNEQDFTIPLCLQCFRVYPPTPRLVASSSA